MKVLMLGVFHDYKRIDLSDFISLGDKKLARNVLRDLVRLGYLSVNGLVQDKFVLDRVNFILPGYSVLIQDIVFQIFTDAYHELGTANVYLHGLLDNGFDVEVVDYRQLSRLIGFDQMQQAILNLAKGKDLVFVSKGEQIAAETYKIIKKLGIPIAVAFFDGNNDIPDYYRESLQYVDAFFMTSGGDYLERYHKVCCPRIAAYYFDPSYPALVDKYKDLPSKYHDIVFTGGYLDWDCDERKQTIIYLKKRTDVVFYGGAEYDIIGGNDIVSRAWRRLTAKRSEQVKGKSYVQAIKSARIGVGVSRRQDIPYYSSDRFSAFCSFGTFYVPWYYPGLEKLFDIGKEIISFNSIEDLDKKITYYLHNPAEREIIAHAAQRKVLEQYNAKNIIGMMLDIIKTGRSDRFEWMQVHKR